MESQDNPKDTTRGRKRKVLTDVEKALRRVQKYVAATHPLEDGNVEQPQLKKRKRYWLLRALSYKDDNGGTFTIIYYTYAKKFEYEPPTFCCGNGYIKLATNEVPVELYALFVYDSEEGKLFRKNIRAYNSIFAFTSFGVNLDKEVASSGKGIYTFKAQEQVYHDLPSLVPKDDTPRYFQLYFYDTDHELDNRMAILQDANLSEEVMGKIRKIVERNPYVQFFLQFKDHSNFQNLEIRIAANGLWIDGNNPNIPFERDIVVHEHSGNKHKVKHYYGCYDPLNNL